jgi:hypothetical protein
MLNRIVMQTEKCTKSDLTVQVRASRKPRFKAGSDLSSKVNLVEVDFNEELTEDQELIEVKLTLSNQRCARTTVISEEAN